MSQKGYIDALLNTLPAEIKRVLIPAFQHVMDTFRVGDGDKATNASWYRMTATTPATADEEFTVAHGLASAPHLLIPVLDLADGGSLVTLSATRSADAHRVYLSSPSTTTVITFYLEV